jgi:hypothetical protein
MLTLSDVMKQLDRELAERPEPEPPTANLDIDEDTLEAIRAEWEHGKAAGAREALEALRWELDARAAQGR